MTDLKNLTVEPQTTTPVFDDYAELPRVVPSRVVPTTVHKGLVVGKGLRATHERYADAYNEAGPGEKVLVKNDFVTDEAFVLKDKGSDVGWVSIEPETSVVAPGVRVTPSMLAFLPTLLAPDAGGAISCDPGAHHVRLSGIVVKPGGAVKQGYQLVNLSASGPETATSQPHDIMLDRMALVADPVGQDQFVRRGIYHVMRGLALINSWVVGFADRYNSDSQAVLLSGGDGQTLIDNNTLGALSENLLAGGSDHPYLLGDLTFTRNHVWKDAAWVPFGFSSKNLFELKTMVRALIAGNLFEQCFPGAQYQAIVMKSVNQDGTMPFAGTTDITFRRNRLRQICAGFSIHANPEAYKKCTPLARVSIHDNLMTDVNAPGEFAQAPGFPSFFFNIAGSIDKLSIKKNIGRSDANLRLIQLGEDGDRLTNLHIDDNDLSGGKGSMTLIGQGAGYLSNNWPKFVDLTTSTLERNTFRADDPAGPRPDVASQTMDNTLLLQSDPVPEYDATDILKAVDGVDGGIPTAPAPVAVVAVPPVVGVVPPVVDTDTNLNAAVNALTDALAVFLKAVLKAKAV